MNVNRQTNGPPIAEMQAHAFVRDAYLLFAKIEWQVNAVRCPLHNKEIW